jgi:prepilin-type N-terminal cleavage/methylation domain-containing protein
MMKKTISQKGFTLIETMVAISILVLATLGPLTIAAQGLNQALFARDQVTAYYLADEAVEYIRNIRDDNALALPKQNWLNGLSNCIGHFCTIDATNAVSLTNPSSLPQQCPSQTGNCGIPLKTDDNGTFFYNSSNGGTNQRNSPFTRTITMTPVPSSAGSNANEERIVVTMSWRTANLPKTFVISENLHNIN